MKAVADAEGREKGGFEEIRNAEIPKCQEI
jgi:hypothetical protein